MRQTKNVFAVDGEGRDRIFMSTEIGSGHDNFFAGQRSRRRMNERSRQHRGKSPPSRCSMTSSGRRAWTV